ELCRHGDAPLPTTPFAAGPAIASSDGRDFPGRSGTPTRDANKVLTQDDVVYLIVTDRFANGDPANDGAVDRGDLGKRHGGDLLGIIQRLPYLRDLGVTVLWITPVYLNPPDAYHGYHPLDFESVDPHLCSPELGPSGSRETVRRFVQIAHEHGLKVMLDMVINHTAPNHPYPPHPPTSLNLNTPSAH